ncbi:MAG: hypothetical protein WKG07_29320 [Hymenobacter sp.]
MLISLLICLLTLLPNTPCPRRNCQARTPAWIWKTFFILVGITAVEFVFVFFMDAQARCATASSSSSPS